MAEEKFLAIHGPKTVEFGEWLTNYVEEIRDYKVYYDHGDRRKPNVAEIRGFFGESLTNKNEVTQIDIMVANREREIITLIQIEESPKSPKEYLAPAFATLMCSNFAVKRQRFKVVCETKLIIAAVVKAKCEPERLRSTVMPRLQEFKVPEDAINLNNIVFVFGKNIASTIEALKELMKEVFPPVVITNTFPAALSQANIRNRKDL